MLDNPCGQEIFTNVWSKPLVKLEAISSCSIHLLWTYLAGWLFYLFWHLFPLSSFTSLVNLGCNLSEPLCFFSVRWWFLESFSILSQSNEITVSRRHQGLESGLTYPDKCWQNHPYQMTCHIRFELLLLSSAVGWYSLPSKSCSGFAQSKTSSFCGTGTFSGHVISVALQPNRPTHRKRLEWAKL